MVNSAAELEATLACLGLERVPDSIAPILLLENWSALMPSLVENLRSSHPCFKLTAEQKQLFKDAYPEIARLYSVENLLKVVGSSVPKDIWLQRLEAADRRVKTLNQMYEALGINMFKQRTADHVFLDDDFWMKVRYSSF